MKSSSSVLDVMRAFFWNHTFFVIATVVRLSAVTGSSRSSAGGYNVIELKYRIDEELPIGSVVGDVTADGNLTSLYGSDRSVIEQLRFRFMRQHSSSSFAIDFRSGVIRTATRIDRETACPSVDITEPEAPCTVRLDVGVQPVEFFRILRVVVEIIDVNDNAPEFPVHSDDTAIVTGRRRQVSLDILESAPVGSSLPLPVAVDRDGPRFSELTYQLSSTAASSSALNQYQSSSYSGSMLGRTSGGGFPFRLVYERPDEKDKHHRSTAESIRLQLTSPLDRESIAEYRLTLIASDAGLPVPLSGTVDVVIRVGDTNDNRPEFDLPVYDVTVPENIPPNTPLVRVNAVDRDAAGPNAAITYLFDPATSTAYGHLFAIDALIGQVSVIDDLDRDRGPPTFRLTVIARDQGSDPLSSTTIVRINVTDINDLAPEIVVDGLIAVAPSSTSRNANVEMVRVTENCRPGTPVAHVTVVDGDDGDAGRFNCSLIDDDNDDDEEHFRLRRFDETEFQLIVSEDVSERTIDRESRDQYHLVIVCTDFGLPVAMTSRQEVIVVVDDINDNPPEFAQSQYKADLIENNYIGAFLVHVFAMDRDAGPNARLEYRLVAEDSGSEYFQCDPATGMIVASRPIDREALPGGSTSFRVIATDSGMPPRTASTSVFVNVQDVNDNKPTFEGIPYLRFSVVENLPAGTSVGVLRAHDHDAGPNGFVRYFIDGDDHELESISFDFDSVVEHDAGDAFIIDSGTGIVSTNRMLDAENVGAYRLIVIAQDHGVPPLSSTATITIEVVDVNDNPPLFLLPSLDDDSTVHLSPFCPAGHVFFRLSANDPDRSASVIEYHLTDADHGPFIVDKETGNVIVSSSGSTNGSSFDVRLPLSAEPDGREFVLNVAAVDVGGLATSTQLHVILNRSVPLDFRFNPTPMDDIDLTGNHHAAATSQRRGLVIGLHVTVVAAVVAVSAAATIGLLIAILVVVVKKRRANPKGKYCVASTSSNVQQYNCRAAAEEARARGGGSSAAGGRGNLTSHCPQTTSSAIVTSCAWYSTPAEMGPADGRWDYRASTIGGDRVKAKDRVTVDGSGSMQMLKWDDGSYINHVTAGSRNGCRRSPFSSPKFSAGVAPRYVTNNHCPPSSSSVVVLSPVVDAQRSNTRMPASCSSNVTNGISLCAAPVPPSTVSGDDGSNTDSGRGFSEEDVGELPPLVLADCRPEPDVTVRYNIVAEETETANNSGKDCLQQPDCSNRQPPHSSLCRSNRRDTVAPHHRFSGSGSTTTSGPTSGYDTAKRVRFQTYADWYDEPFGNNLNPRRVGGEFRPSNTSALRQPERADGDDVIRAPSTTSGGQRRTTNENERVTRPERENIKEQDVKRTSGECDAHDLCNEIDRLFFTQHTPI